MFYLTRTIILACCFSAGCKSSIPKLQPIAAKADCIQKFKPTFKADWYNATVDVIGRHISGLVLFKARPDSTMRVVFTNEVGVTFFDFEFGKGRHFKVHQIIEQMDIKAVINLLRKDFEMIMMQDVIGKELKTFVSNNEIFYALPRKKETDYFITDKECATLLRIEKLSKRKKMVEVVLVGEKHQSPDTVHLKHFTFDMQISLKKIHR